MDGYGTGRVEDIRIEGPVGKLSLRIGGTIDRMDSKEGTLRIVDYKTGGSPKSTGKYRTIIHTCRRTPQLHLQTFLYAAIMARQQALKVAPSLLYIHRAASESYSPVIEIGEARKPKLPVDDFSVYEDEFRERLLKLLEEIYDDKEEFTQTKDTKKCEYCDFKAMCKR